MNQDIFKNLHSGEDYLPSHPELLKEQTACQELLYDYNQTRPSEKELRQQLLQKMFASLGEGVTIEPPFQANWGGHFCHIGNHVYINYNLTMVDDTTITIGDKTMLGPNVTLTTAGHPLDPDLRAQGFQTNQPITIGKNCWLGADVTVLAGVSIGDNSVIGAGSLVTKDIPQNVLAYGRPAKIIKNLKN